MAFVNELIPQEEKDKFDPNDFSFRKGHPYRFSDLSKWTVDREENSFLIHLSGSMGVDGPDYFAFNWGEGEVVFDAYKNIASRENKKSNISWVIPRLRLPSSANQKKVTDLLRSAFSAYGYLNRPEAFESIFLEIKTVI